MLLVTPSVQNSLIRQVNHWLLASKRLATLEHLASGNAWQGIDHQISMLLKASLQKSVGELISTGEIIKKQLEGSDDPESLRSAKRSLIMLRDRYLKTEETIHFYTVAINSRTTARIAALLRACDILCKKSMDELLEPLGKASPPVFTYVDKGVGASILKAGLRLWNGNISPVAAIKITQHNLFRPTAIIHETGHQVAHILNWNNELADKLNISLSSKSPVAGAAFASWASEIAADAFAFVHAGYASVAALHDVVSGSPQSVFAYRLNDPHPISYIRVLMNIAMCRQCYGPGPWDKLEVSFKNDYDINLVDFSSLGLIRHCIPLIEDAVNLILNFPFNAFGQRPLAKIIQPEKVSPRALNELEKKAGPALFTSHAWIWNESIRLLALNGYQIGTGIGDMEILYRQQEDWMVKLGFSVGLN